MLDNVFAFDVYATDGSKGHILKVPVTLRDVLDGVSGQWATKSPDTRSAYAIDILLVSGHSGGKALRAFILYLLDQASPSFVSQLPPVCANLLQHGGHAMAKSPLVCADSCRAWLTCLCGISRSVNRAVFTDPTSKAAVLCACLYSALNIIECNSLVFRDLEKTFTEACLSAAACMREHLSIARGVLVESSNARMTLYDFDKAYNDLHGLALRRLHEIVEGDK